VVQISLKTYSDIILLFQRPTLIKGRRNYDVHLTHLVTPISTDIIEDKKRPDYKWCRKVKLIAVADPLDSIPNPGYFRFFKPNRGQTHPITNLENIIGLNVDETRKLIWDLFSGYFCPRVDVEPSISKQPAVHLGWEEGDKQLRKHVTLESTKRSAAAVRAAKLMALRAGNGRVLCECCQFDFFAEYGKHGQGYIEAHHRDFISTGKRITKPGDLALVCSNCHRMLHRRDDNGNFPTVEDIIRLIRMKS
jgi:hypothetical protein